MYTLRDREHIRSRREIILLLRRRLRALLALRPSAGARRRLRYAAFTLGGFFAAQLPLGGLCPLGAGLAGAFIGTPLCLPAGLGALFGYALSGQSHSLRWAVVTVGVLLCAVVLGSTSASARAVFGPLVAAGASAVAGAASLVGGHTGAAWLLLLCESLLAGGSALILRTALSPARGEGGEERRLPARLCVAAVLTGGLCVVGLPAGMTVGGLAATGLTLGWGMLGAGGPLCGLLCGLAVDLAMEQGPCYAVLLPAAAIVSALFARMGRLAACLAFCMAGGLCALWTGAGEASLWQLCICGAAIALLPLPRPSVRAPALRVQSRAEDRLTRTAEAYDAVCAALRTAPDGGTENLENPAAILRAAADEACADCPRRVSCWAEGYETTRDMLSAALPRLIARGRVLREDLPPAFCTGCMRFAEFLSALNRALCLFVFRRRLAAALEDSRDILLAQYGDFARLLRQQAAEIGRAMRFHPRAERRLMQEWVGRGMRISATVYTDAEGRLAAELEGTGTARISRDEQGETARISRLLGRPMMLSEIESGNGGTRIYFREADRLRLSLYGMSGCSPGMHACGDLSRYVRLRSGKSFVIFSDGMGHGSDAAERARRTLRLLESNLRAGLKPELALRILNSVLLLRDGGTAFATVDMLEFDPVSGSACLYKCGAAPSWLCRAGTVHRVAPGGLPAGLGLEPPSLQRMLLRAGDCVVLLSDGVSDGEEDEWLARCLRLPAEQPAELCRRILQAAPASRDDMTVITLFVQPR